MSYLASILFTGIGATAVMDLCGIARKPLLGAPPPDYGLVGRWVAHMRHGRFRHDAITKASPVRGERLLGWTAHYLTGIAFAAVLIGFQGQAWLVHPTLAPAIVVGIGTVLAPYLIMQPGMGAGIAASRTPRPRTARLQTLLTHTFFGVGLYVAGWGFHFLCAP
jgi:hypothetical protein